MSTFLLVSACNVDFSTASFVDARTSNCGNGRLDPDESCDGTDFGGLTCQALGRPGGTLSCTADCTLDLSGCSTNSKCQGECTPCSSQEEADGCGSIQGCTWMDQGCVGQCSACVSLTADACSSQLGCMPSNGACSGTCLSCASLAQENDCLDQEGCSWTAGTCSGSPVPCASRSRSDCTDGCTFQGPGCRGGSLSCEQVTSQTACEEVGCLWNDRGGSHCYADDPFPSTHSCDMISDEELCTNETGGQCQWSASSTCTGTPDPCSGRSENTCVRGCTWHPGGCEGTCQPCESFTDGSSCSGQLGCAWQDADCAGSCTACSELEPERCGDQLGCQWLTGGACIGSCTPCADLPDEASCEAQPGCLWASN